MFYTILQGKESVGDPILCSNCSLPDKEATVRCLDCKEFFCPTCQRSHDSFKVMKQHKVISIEDLRSGKIMIPLTTTEDQKCLDHDKSKRFYCQTCEEPICRDCTILDHRQHQFISLKDASKMQVSKLLDLAKKGENLMMKYKNAITKTEKVEENLADASKNAKEKLGEIKREYLKQLDALFRKHEADVDSLENQRATKLGDTKNDLQSQLAKVENACELASKITQMGSDYDIASIYPILSASLEEVVGETEPESGDELLGFIFVKIIGKAKIPDAVSLVKGETWMQTRQLRTVEKLSRPCRIAVNKDGNVALANWQRSAKLFSHDGGVICTFKCGPFSYPPIVDIAITPDNRYVIPGKSEILFFDGQGNRLEYPEAATYDMNNKPSFIMALAVDSRGRIIVGLYENTISIHHSDGQLISKFATNVRPNFGGLAVTSTGNIVATFDDDTLQVMD